jgi:D-alanyl-D-alanine carboxypeptidase
MTERADTLEANLIAEQEKNSIFSGQINQIAGTVGNLDKLAKTDKELLQKYSKVYFLNEHYVPDALENIPPDYLYEKSRVMQFHAKAYPYLQELLVAAERDGIDLKIVSAYRSFGEQSVLKSNYSVSYGSGANKFSADQGYSEHQLGTTIDFTTSQTGADFNKFSKTESFNWLKENAYKYGFILSYPDGNNYYQYEPWHWRFVGKALAYRLHEEKDNFYDLNQSQIDPYLIKIFD